MNRYCLISLKTIGYSSSRLKISEICLAHYDKNQESIVLHEFVRQDSLLINSENIQTAKYFHEIARSIVELTKGTVLVAEDVYQECTLLKKEFLSLGFQFNVKTLSITSILARGPQTVGQSCLEKIKSLSRRLENLLQSVDDIEIQRKIKRKIPAPSQFDDSVFRELPAKPGVYFFKDKLDHIIYIGKAKNLSSRVPNHLGFSPERFKHLEFKNSVSKLDFVVCGSEIEAILLEIYLIKKWVPPFNRKLKTKKFPFGVFFNEGEQFFYCRRYEEGDHPLRTTRSKKSALKLIDLYQERSILPMDLDFKQAELTLMINDTTSVEISNRRWLKWKHSEPLDLYQYPEIKGELLKWIKSKVDGTLK